MPGQYAFAFPGDGAVARDHHRKAEAGRGEHARVVQNALAVAAVRAAHQQEDVGVDLKYLLQVVLRQLKGKHLQHFRARAQAGLPRGLGGQLRHQPAGDHPQSARSGGTGVARGEIQRPRLLLQFCQGFFKPLVHVRLHRGVGVGGAQQGFHFYIYGGDLRVCAAEINQQDGLHAFSSSVSRISCSA